MIEQLSFDVVPRVAHDGDPAEIISSELKLQGELRLQGQLNHGDELIITVTGIDGEVLAQQHAEISKPPSFAPIEEKDIGLLGYSRVHNAKIGDPA